MSRLSRVVMLICGLVVSISIGALVIHLAGLSGIYWGMPINDLWNCIPLFILMLICLRIVLNILARILRKISSLIDPYSI